MVGRVWCGRGSTRISYAQAFWMFYFDPGGPISRWSALKRFYFSLDAISNFQYVCMLQDGFAMKTSAVNGSRKEICFKSMLQNTTSALAPMDLVQSDATGFLETVHLSSPVSE